MSTTHKTNYKIVIHGSHLQNSRKAKKAKTFFNLNNDQEEKRRCELRDHKGLGALTSAARAVYRSEMTIEGVSWTKNAEAVRRCLETQ